MFKKKLCWVYGLLKKCSLSFHMTEDSKVQINQKAMLIFKWGTDLDKPLNVLSKDLCGE